MEETIVKTAITLLEQAGKPIDFDQLFAGLEAAGIPLPADKPKLVVRKLLHESPQISSKAGGFTVASGESAASKPKTSLSDQLQSMRRKRVSRINYLRADTITPDTEAPKPAEIHQEEEEFKEKSLKEKVKAVLASVDYPLRFSDIVQKVEQKGNTTPGHNLEAALRVVLRDTESFALKDGHYSLKRNIGLGSVLKSLKEKMVSHARSGASSANLSAIKSARPGPAEFSSPKTPEPVASQAPAANNTREEPSTAAPKTPLTSTKPPDRRAFPPASEFSVPQNLAETARQAAMEAAREAAVEMARQAAEQQAVHETTRQAAMEAARQAARQAAAEMARQAIEQQATQEAARQAAMEAAREAARQTAEQQASLRQSVIEAARQAAREIIQGAAEQQASAAAIRDAAVQAAREAAFRAAESSKPVSSSSTVVHDLVEEAVKTVELSDEVFKIRSESAKPRPTPTTRTTPTTRAVRVPPPPPVSTSDGRSGQASIRERIDVILQQAGQPLTFEEIFRELKKDSYPLPLQKPEVVILRVLANESLFRRIGKDLYGIKRNRE